MNYFKYLFAIILIVVVYGCGGSKEVSEREEEELKKETKEVADYEDVNGIAIMLQAQIEQQNRMYSKEEDTTYLYWLNNTLIILNNSTKCNIYALNTLFKAGFKCPNVNTLTRDLVDTTRFNNIFPYVKIESPEEIRKGDLVIWNGHVILFEKLVKLSNRLFAQAWWAGTRQSDNGSNIINNVIYGKYPLEGYYIVRRPVKN